MEPILKTEGLWKTYRSGKVETSALRGVNFEVLPGEFVTVMGPSGCGKSTLLYVIGGLARATKGRVLVDGNDLAAMSDAERTNCGGTRSDSSSSDSTSCPRWMLLAISPSRSTFTGMDSTRTGSRW